MQNNISDKILIEQLLRGDVESFDNLFSKYSRKLYGFALRYLKSKSDAEDLVQSVFVKVWERRGSLKKEASFNSYLFTIAYHDIQKIFRAKSYFSAYAKEAVTNGDLADNSVEGMDYGSVLERVDQLIAQMSGRRREIFVKSRKEGLTSKEIARDLEISPGTVDNNISEALKFLREHLKDEGIAITLYFCLFVQ